MLTIVFDESVLDVFAYSCGTSFATIYFLLKIFVPNPVNTRCVILLSLITVLKSLDGENKRLD